MHIVITIVIFTFLCVPALFSSDSSGNSEILESKKTIMEGKPLLLFSNERRAKTWAVEKAIMETIPWVQERNSKLKLVYQKSDMKYKGSLGSSGLLYKRIDINNGETTIQWTEATHEYYYLALSAKQGTLLVGGHVTKKGFFYYLTLMEEQAGKIETKASLEYSLPWEGSKDKPYGLLFRKQQNPVEEFGVVFPVEIKPFRSAEPKGYDEERQFWKVKCVDSRTFSKKGEQVVSLESMSQCPNTSLNSDFVLFSTTVDPKKITNPPVKVLWVKITEDGGFKADSMRKGEGASGLPPPL